MVCKHVIWGENHLQLPNTNYEFRYNAKTILRAGLVLFCSSSNAELFFSEVGHLREMLLLVHLVQQLANSIFWGGQSNLSLALSPLSKLSPTSTIAAPIRQSSPTFKPILAVKRSWRRSSLNTMTAMKRKQRQSEISFSRGLTHLAAISRSQTHRLSFLVQSWRCSVQMCVLLLFLSPGNLPYISQILCKYCSVLFNIVSFLYHHLVCASKSCSHETTCYVLKMCSR